MHLNFTFLETDTPVLRSVVADVAIDLFALLPWSGDFGGTHFEDGFDGGPSHDVNEVIDGVLGGVEEIEQRQKQLADFGQSLGEWQGLEGCFLFILIDDVVVFRHRWWFLGHGFLDTPDDTVSSSSSPPPNLTFNYEWDIIRISLAF